MCRGRGVDREDEREGRDAVFVCLKHSLGSGTRMVYDMTNILSNVSELEQ